MFPHEWPKRFTFAKQRGGIVVANTQLYLDNPPAPGRPLGKVMPVTMGDRLSVCQTPVPYPVPPGMEYRLDYYQVRCWYGTPDRPADLEQGNLFAYVLKSAVRLLPIWEEWPQDPGLCQAVYKTRSADEYSRLPLAEMVWETTIADSVYLAPNDPNAKPIRWLNTPASDALPVEFYTQPPWAYDGPPPTRFPVRVINEEALPESLQSEEFKQQQRQRRLMDDGPSSSNGSSAAGGCLFSLASLPFWLVRR